MSEHERIPGTQLDISDLRFSVDLDGRVVLEEATLPDWFSPQQRDEAKADLIKRLAAQLTPDFRAKGIEATFAWRSDIEKKDDHQN